jgi:TonB family protein
MGRIGSWNCSSAPSNRDLFCTRLIDKSGKPMSHNSRPRFRAVARASVALATCALAAHAYPAPAADSPAKPTRDIDINSCAHPRYPADDLRAEHTGKVTLAFLVNDDGKVVDSRVEKSSGYSGLDEAARVPLSLCHFKAMPDDKPGLQWVRIQWVWTLD